RSASSTETSSSRSRTSGSSSTRARMIHIRPEISSLPANSRDDPAPAEAKRLGIANPFKLNNNESPWPPFPDAVEAIQAHLEDLNWYPDPTYARLREALGEHHRIDPDR